VTLKIAALGALLALMMLLGTACGGSDHESSAEAHYRAYRAAEDRRDEAEARLRRAFAGISAAAQREDRAGVLGAAKRGQQAADDIDALLGAELEAARGLGASAKVGADGQRLAHGLQLTRDSLALVAKELDIALDDPFLAHRAKEVHDLAKEATDLAVKGELAVRRADQAIAIALGVQPRPDQLFTTTG
jgi:hypothetical protein